MPSRTIEINIRGAAAALRSLAAPEQTILDLLGEAFNLHQAIDQVHPADREEFMRAIHQAQNIVLARPAVEAQLDRVPVVLEPGDHVLTPHQGQVAGIDQSGGRPPVFE